MLIYVRNPHTALYPWRSLVRDTGGHEATAWSRRSSPVVGQIRVTLGSQRCAGRCARPPSARGGGPGYTGQVWPREATAASFHASPNTWQVRRMCLLARVVPDKGSHPGFGVSKQQTIYPFLGGRMSQAAKGQRRFFMAPSWQYVHRPAGQRDGQAPSQGDWR